MNSFKKFKDDMLANPEIKEEYEGYNESNT